MPLIQCGTVGKAMAPLAVCSPKISPQLQTQAVAVVVAAEVAVVASQPVLQVMKYG